MSPSNDDHPHHSYRADVAPLQKALSSPSPLGNILDNLHRNHSEGDDGSRYNISPSNLNNNDSSFTIGKSEYSGSIATSVVSTIVDGVHHTIAHWKILLFGQLLSFFLAAAGAASEELNRACHVSIPLTQTALVAGSLMLLGAFRMRGWCAGCCLVPGTKKTDGDSGGDENFQCNGDSNDGENRSIIQSPLNDGDGLSFFEGIQTDGRNSHDESRKPTSQPRSFCCGLQTIHAPWWAYFVVALAAVEGRYFIFLAFKYTSFSFIFLAEAMALPSAMVFSKCLLGRNYRFSHVLGGFVCMSGILLSAISDLKGSDIENIGSRSDVNSLEHLKGDILALSGSVLLGLDDVLSEMLLKSHGEVDEVLFVKWFFGLGISVAQLVILERDSLFALFDNQDGGTCNESARFYLLGGYVVFQVLDMAGENSFLGISEAALLNLSLLTSNLWATVFSFFAEGLVPPGLYYASLFLIVVGIVLYEAGPSPIGHATPSDIKVRMQLETDTAGFAGNANKGGITLEMT